MKPSWKDAPDWANWLAMDENGEWGWYEYPLDICDDMWLTSEGRLAYAGRTEYDSDRPDWIDSLEQRPRTKPSINPVFESIIDAHFGVKK